MAQLERGGPHLILPGDVIPERVEPANHPRAPIDPLRIEGGASRSLPSHSIAAILRAMPGVIACLNPTRNPPMTPRPRSLLALGFALPLLALAVGCGAESKPKTKLQSRETLGKTTQEVRNLQPELAQGGQVSDGKIHSTDYI